VAEIVGLSMPRRFEYSVPKPPPADASRRLAEALLSAELHKTPRVLTIRFDEPRDSNIVHRTLVGLRNSYDPKG
jgi:hypothetical protein